AVPAIVADSRAQAAIATTDARLSGSRARFHGAHHGFDSRHPSNFPQPGLAGIFQADSGVAQPAFFSRSEELGGLWGALLQRPSRPANRLFQSAIGGQS